MKKSSYRFIGLAIIAALLIAWPSVSSAYEQLVPSYLDFTILANQAGASITYAGGVNPLIGSNIVVSSIASYTEAGDEIKSLAITNGKLNFTTGNNSNTIGDTNWLFSSGGSITITGDVTINGVTRTNVTLLSGSFSALSSVLVVDSNSKFKIVAASISDTKDSGLVQYFGFDTESWQGSLNQQFSLSSKNIHTPSAFTSASVLSGDVSNTPVPIPAAFLLFGSGLFGLVCVRRRKI